MDDALQSTQSLTRVAAGIFIACWCISSFTADAQTPKSQPESNWQAQAVRKYPALGIKDSDFNKRFLEAFHERRQSNLRFFDNPRWPLLLADEVAASTFQATAGAVDQTRTAPVPQTTIPAATKPTHRANAEPAAPPIAAQPRKEQSSLVWPVAAAVGAIAIILIIRIARSTSREQSAKRALAFAEARTFADHVRQAKTLPTVTTSVMLKSGESAFYSAPARLFETRAVRHYGGGHVGFRVAKGVYVGGSRGRSVSNQEWTLIDSGRLTITNKRLIFDGGQADRAVLLTKVLSAESSSSGVEVSVESRQKSMVFDAANPLILATIIHICCRADDPLDLSQTKLDFTFAE